MAYLNKKDKTTLLVAAGVLMGLRDNKRLSKNHRERIASVGDELLAVAIKVNQGPKPKEQNNAN